MLIRNNNEIILNEYIDFLSDKGKIIKIKDTSKNTNIKFSNGRIFYFLLIVSLVLIVLTMYLISNKPSIDNEGNNVIVIGIALFTAIVIGVTINEKNNLKINVSYPNEKQIKVNNKIFDIEKEDCYIDISKNFEFIHNRSSIINPRLYSIQYFLKIRGKRNSKLLRITNGREEQMRDLIYNFEYEISDIKKKSSEFVQDIQNFREEYYEKGYTTQDKLEEFYKKIDENRYKK